MFHFRIKNAAPGRRISQHCHGQFIEHLGGCIYDGIFVGEHDSIAHSDGLRNDTVTALKHLQIPNIRWPGGLFADNYHWRDGIGPRSQRPIRQNLGWNSLERHQFGTHEFMRFCELVGAEPYLCLNVGSGTVAEAAAWAEYCNCPLDTTLTRERANNGHPQPFGVKFWSLGNEPGYPMDGMMRPGHYADVARRFSGYVKHVASQAAYAQDPRFREAGVKMTLADYRCAREAVQEGRHAYFDLLAVHLYAGRAAKPEASAEQHYLATIAELPEWQKQIRLASDMASELSTAEHQIELAVDEWGVWKHEATPLNGLAQSCTLGDALFSAAALHLFYAEPNVFMANLAQTVNVLDAVILTDGERFCRTPLYHVFDLFKVHQNALFLPVEALSGQSPALSAVASKSDSGAIHLSLVNLSLDEHLQIRCEPVHRLVRIVDGRILTGASIAEQNTFDEPAKITPAACELPKLINNAFEIAIPPRAIMLLTLE